MSTFVAVCAKDFYVGGISESLQNICGIPGIELLPPAGPIAMKIPVVVGVVKL